MRGARQKSRQHRAVAIRPDEKARLTETQRDRQINQDAQARQDWPHLPEAPAHLFAFSGKDARSCPDRREKAQEQQQKENDDDRCARPEIQWDHLQQPKGQKDDDALYDGAGIACPPKDAPFRRFLTEMRRWRRGRGCGRRVTDRGLWGQGGCLSHGSSPQNAVYLQKMVSRSSL